MKQSSKYSLNGVYKCENFEQHMDENDFPKFPIGSALGLDGWYIEFRLSKEYGKLVVYPFISNQNLPNVRVGAYFNILKNDGSSASKCELVHIYMESYKGCRGFSIDIDKLFNEKNGYLDERAITVEYGLQVISAKEGDGIWKFNFFDLFFNWQNQDNMFDFIIRHEISLFGHKQIIKLHSKKIFDLQKDWVRVPKSITLEKLVMCLQITHGVRLQMTAKELERIIGIAFHFGFSNTVRYCEQQLIKMDEQTKMKLTRKVKLAVKFKLEHYLNHLVKQIKSPERLMRTLKRLNIEKMSSESMKTFVGKYLDLNE